MAEMTMLTALRDAIARRKDFAEVKVEFEQASTFVNRLRLAMAKERKDAANETLMRVTCAVLGVDPDDVTEESVYAATDMLLQIERAS